METNVTMTTNSETVGTSLQGTIATTYDRLVEIFGEPNGSPCEKSTVEWRLRFPDGTIATIYDWKLNNTPKDLYDWHIGGFNKKAVKAIFDVVF